jgi:aspartate oxidase
MDQEIKEGRGCGPDGAYVHLKLDHLGADVISKRLPSILEIGHKFANVDATKEPIPVVPTIHYQMGGIPCNYNGQVTTWDGKQTHIVNGLYAIGECSATSVHGANRLGTNSLLDLIVFGRAAGNHIVAAHPERQHAHQPLAQESVDFSLDRVNKLESRTKGEKTQVVGNDIRNAMQQHCGVFRTLASLNEGVKKIDALAGDQIAAHRERVVVAGIVHGDCEAAVVFGHRHAGHVGQSIAQIQHVAKRHRALGFRHVFVNRLTLLLATLVDAEQVLRLAGVVDDDSREAGHFVMIEVILRGVDALEVMLDADAFQNLA